MARTIEAGAVAYTSPFENHPAVVQALANGRSLWGNPPAVLRRTRDPRQLAGALRQRGFMFPRRAFSPATAPTGPRTTTGW